MARDSRNTTILLVEDERIVALAEQLVLTREGYSVVLAETGEAAIQAVKRNRDVALVLMDIDLGSGIDGVEAAERILDVRMLPIVFLTSHQEKAVVEGTRDLTSYGYVIKDSGEFVLLESVRMALELFRAHVGSRRSATQLRALFDAATDPVFVMDAELRIVLANHTAAALADTDPSGAQGHSFQQMYPEYADEARLVVMACLREQVPMEFTAEVQLKSLKERRYRCRCTPVEIVEYGGPCVQFVLKEIPEEIETDGTPPVDTLLPAITRNAPGFLFRLTRSSSGRFAFTYVSEGISRHFGFRATDIVEDPGTLIRAIPAAEHTRLRRAMHRSVASNGELSEIHRLISASGTTMWVKFQASAERREDRSVAWTGMGIDVTDEVRAIEQLRKALQEHEDLTREMNHRVKNNLAMVTSLLELKQAASSPTVDLSDVTYRIDAIRLLHDLMHRTESAQHIDMQRYLESIVGTAFSALGETEVMQHLTVPEVSLPVDQALPIALIVNELATNAVKHGFPNAEEKEFSLSLSRTASGFALAVSNSGPALPDRLPESSGDGMGLRLVESLAEQLSGELTVDCGPPPRFQVRFPVLE